MIKQLKHQWHLMSGYCIFCGISLKDALETKAGCTRDKKVQAISHTRAMSRAREKYGLRTSSKDYDTDT